MHHSQSVGKSWGYDGYCVAPHFIDVYGLVQTSPRSLAGPFSEFCHQLGRGSSRHAEIGSAVQDFGSESVDCSYPIGYLNPQIKDIGNYPSTPGPCRLSWDAHWWLETALRVRILCWKGRYLSREMRLVICTRADSEGARRCCISSSFEVCWHFNAEMRTRLYLIDLFISKDCMNRKS